MYSVLPLPSNIEMTRKPQVMAMFGSNEDISLGAKPRSSYIGFKIPLGM